MQQKDVTLFLNVLCLVILRLNLTKTFDWKDFQISEKKTSHLFLAYNFIFPKHKMIQENNSK